MNEATTLCKSLAFEADGVNLISPCLTFEVFVEFAEGPEVLDFYQRVREALGEQLTYYTTGSGRYSKITKRSESLMPTWCDNPTSWPKKQYCLLMNGAELGATAASLRIDFLHRPYVAPDEALLRKWRSPGFSSRWIYPYTCLYCTIPLDHPLAQEDAFANWITQFKLFNEGRFISGSCGFGLNFPYNYPSSSTSNETRNRIASSLLRYPGLDIQSIMLGVGTALLQRDQEFMNRHKAAKGRPYLKRVNWLTFLSEDQVDYLGGLPALREQFSTAPEIKLRELKYGVCVQAGPNPQLGSSANDDYIPFYQKVARAVRPVRVDALSPASITDEFGHAGVIDWLNAFDQ